LQFTLRGPLLKKDTKAEDFNLPVMIKFFFAENFAARPVALQLPVLIAAYIFFLHANTIVCPVCVTVKDEFKNQKLVHFFIYFGRILVARVYI